MADDGASPAIDDLEVAVAHWHVNAWGGAEYLVTHLAEALSVDRIYTIGPPSPGEPNPYGDVEFYDVTRDLSLAPLRSLQRRVGRVFEYALWEDVDWREYGHPGVLVTSGTTTRAVITPDDTLHVNYCHSPPRWFYDLYHDRKEALIGLLARPLLRYLRLRDATVDPRVDYYLANSPIVARRLSKYYDRGSTVLHPPVDLSKYRDDGDEGFYLHLGRLNEEKGVPELVDSFKRTGHELVLAGGAGDVDAETMGAIERATNIDYRGFVPEDEKYDLLARCRAVVFNGRNEDFGIVPIEAAASGKACLARNEGFPAVFVKDRENGYTHDGTAAGIRECIERFESEGLAGNPRDSAAEFSLESFRSQLVENLTTWHTAVQPAAFR